MRIVMILLLSLFLMSGDGHAESYWDNHWSGNAIYEGGIHSQKNGPVADFAFGLHSVRGVKNELNILLIHSSDPTVSSNQHKEVNESGKTRDTLGPQYYRRFNLKQIKDWRFSSFIGVGSHLELSKKKTHSFINEGKLGISFRSEKIEWLFVYTRAKSNNNLYNRRSLGVNLRLHFEPL